MNLQDPLVLPQPERCAHRLLRLAAVQLALREHQEVERLRALPCGVEPLVAARRRVLLLKYITWHC